MFPYLVENIGESESNPTAKNNDIICKWFRQKLEQMKILLNNHDGETL
jgi:hypothetical protein